MILYVRSMPAARCVDSGDSCKTFNLKSWFFFFFFKFNMNRGFKHVWFAWKNQRNRVTLGFMYPISTNFVSLNSAYDCLHIFRRVRSTPAIRCRRQFGPVREFSSERRLFGTPTLHIHSGDPFLFLQILSRIEALNVRVCCKK